jgi:hypothetical protein
VRCFISSRAWFVVPEQQLGFNLLPSGPITERCRIQRTDTHTIVGGNATHNDALDILCLEDVVEGDLVVSIVMKLSITLKLNLRAFVHDGIEELLVKYIFDPSDPGTQ